MFPQSHPAASRDHPIPMRTRGPRRLSDRHGPDCEFLHKYRIDFQQLPFQIYEAIKKLEG